MNDGKQVACRCRDEIAWMLEAEAEGYEQLERSSRPPTFSSAAGVMFEAARLVRSGATAEDRQSTSG